MTNKRIFVKKRNGYNKEELQLRDNLNLEFNLGLDSVELYVIYDVFMKFYLLNTIKELTAQKKA